MCAGTDRDRQPLSAAVTSDRPPQLERLQRERWHFAVSATKFHSLSPFHLLSCAILLFSASRFSAGYPKFLKSQMLSHSPGHVSSRNPPTPLSRSLRNYSNYIFRELRKELARQIIISYTAKLPSNVVFQKDSEHFGLPTWSDDTSYEMDFQQSIYSTKTNVTYVVWRR